MQIEKAVKRSKPFALAILAAGLGGMIAKYSIVLSIIFVAGGGIPLLYLFVTDIKCKYVNLILTIVIFLSIMIIVGAYTLERVSPITSTLILYERDHHGTWGRRERSESVNLTQNPHLTGKFLPNQGCYYLDLSVEHKVLGSILYDPVLSIILPSTITQTHGFSQDWQEEPYDSSRTKFFTDKFDKEGIIESCINNGNIPPYRVSSDA